MAVALVAQFRAITTRDLLSPSPSGQNQSMDRDASRLAPLIVALGHGEEDMRISFTFCRGPGSSGRGIKCRILGNPLCAMLAVAAIICVDVFFGGCVANVVKHKGLRSRVRPRGKMTVQELRSLGLNQHMPENQTKTPAGDIPKAAPEE